MEVSVEVAALVAGFTGKFVAAQLAGWALAVWFTGAWD